jgi:3-oxoacyl-(acyl-carrier-protein) synthase
MEQIPSPTGISEDGAAFERAMRMALRGLNQSDTLLGVVMHAPGSQRGDRAELAAIQRVFGEIPVYSTKHLTGHTYGAAPMLNLSLGKALLEGLSWQHSPYGQKFKGKISDVKAGNVVLVNSAGFGGNAVSVAIGRSEGLSI